MEFTVTCGGATAGYPATGSVGMEIAPASMMTAATTPAKIGRVMKNLVNISSSLRLRRFARRHRPGRDHLYRHAGLQSGGVIEDRHDPWFEVLTGYFHLL